MNDEVSHLLDGTSMQYTYSEMGTVQTSYNDGRISFEWLKGPLQGQTGGGFIYRSREVGEYQFLANWHEPDPPGFVTLFIDFKAGQVHSSLIAAYGSDEEQIHFDSASIDTVKRA